MQAEECVSESREAKAVAEGAPEPLNATLNQLAEGSSDKAPEIHLLHDLKKCKTSRSQIVVYLNELFEPSHCSNDKLGIDVANQGGSQVIVNHAHHYFCPFFKGESRLECLVGDYLTL